jgi:membrane fusion protein (multidrug efflux system)
MKKIIFFSILGLILLVGVLGGIKALQIRQMIAQGEQFVMPPTTVTTAAVESVVWPSELTAVGSLEAVQGVMVTAELNGKVTKIAFEPGSAVKAGDLLVQQDTSSEAAQLRSAEASMELARLNLERAKELLPEKVITQLGAMTVPMPNISKRQHRWRPFVPPLPKKRFGPPSPAVLGIRLVNLGQTLERRVIPSSPCSPWIRYLSIFNCLSRSCPRFSEGLTVKLTTDALPGEVIAGTITAINPQVDSTTRNVRVQATVTNTREQLHPGMFVNVVVVLPNVQNVCWPFQRPPSSMPPTATRCLSWRTKKDDSVRAEYPCASNSYAWGVNGEILSRF